jgi:hypothetical protein
MLLSACGPLGIGRRPAPPAGFAEGDRQDPALSGDGRWLASIVARGGRETVLLQEQASGRVVRLDPLRRHQPHRSPSLSWNGRYLAVVGQWGPRPTALVLDRLTGRLVPLQLPGEGDPERISLAPDGRRLAVERLRAGRRRIEVLDLSSLLEPDPPPGPLAPGASPTPPAGER